MNDIICLDKDLTSGTTSSCASELEFYGVTGLTATGYNTDYIGILGLGYSEDFAHSFVNRWALTTGNEAVAYFYMAYDE